MSQTAYPIEAAVAFPGMLGEGGKEFSISRANEDAVAIGAGRPVVVGTDPETQAAASFRQNENMEIVRKGRIWVTVEEAVVYGDPVFFRHTVNGPLVPGGWRNDADTTNADAVPEAIFASTAAIDTVALIEINLP